MIPIFRTADETGYTLKPKGDAAKFPFSYTAVPNKNYRLFVVGETETYYQWKDEPDGPAFYHVLTDSLDNAVTNKAQYSLNVSAKEPKQYVWRAYKKILWKPGLSYMPLYEIGNVWNIGFSIRTRQLRFEEGGYLRMYVEVYEKTEGVSQVSPAQNISQTYEIRVEEGDCDWVTLQKEIYIDEEKTSYVGFWLEGTGYTGEVHIERPFLYNTTKMNLLPDFSVPVGTNIKFDWAAQNLSHKEWIDVEISLNGQEVYCGEVPERIHRKSDWSIDVPKELLRENNELSIRVVSDYHDPLPYSIYEVALIEQNAGKVALIAAPEIAVQYQNTYILIRTEEADSQVQISYLDGKLSGTEDYFFREPGLHVITAKCGGAAKNAEFVISCQGESVKGCIERIVEKENDGVLTGTGDLIYINQAERDFEEYISWYFSEGLGNMLTIRTTYRWGMSRVYNPKLWKLLVRLLNEMGVFYSHMWDGRELPGLDGNPAETELRDKYFLGRQMHEADGGLLYGGNSATSGILSWQLIDMNHRMNAEHPERVCMGHNMAYACYVGDAIYRRNPHVERDVKIGRDNLVESLRKTMATDVRHTGPSVMFKYFVQAGYSFVGAETMYTTMEPQMAFLRGTKRCYQLPAVGTHHALQWNSTPMDSPEHIRRYRLALYVSYMQGADQINTEEGSWHMEEYYTSFHRFSECCRLHTEQQQDFSRYVMGHSRKGSYYTPVAFLQGQYDPWHGFINYQPWGWTDRHYGEAEASWQLLKTVYPKSQPGDALYYHRCPSDKAVGYYSGTPNGNVDVIPAESGANVYKQYKVLAFLGYHCADRENLERLLEFVKCGGKLILTRAHMTTTTNYDDISNKKLKYGEDMPLSFVSGEPVFENITYQGHEIEVCVNGEPCEEVIQSETGHDIVCRYRIGKGEVVLFNVNAYPAHPSIKALYENELRTSMKKAVSEEDVWAQTGDDVEFSVYDCGNGEKHIYLLAVDWYREPSIMRKAILIIGSHRYEIDVPFGVMLKCVVKDGVGVYAYTEDVEILNVDSNTCRVQGTGRDSIVILSEGKATTKAVDFSEQTIQVVSYKK